MKYVLSTWALLCAGSLAYAFVALPAWGTEGDFVPSGSALFLFLVLIVSVAWIVGVVVIFAVDAAIDVLRSRLRHP